MTDFSPLSTGPTLFLTDEEIGALVSPDIRPASFAKLCSELESYGFPKRDPLFKRRYWPAVKAWFDRRHGIGEASPETLAPDGEENWDGEAKRLPRPDNTEAPRRARPALVRREPVAELAGVPGRVDPFTNRRHRRGNP